jgi:hypothetical protein
MIPVSRHGVILPFIGICVSSAEAEKRRG